LLTGESRLGAGAGELAQRELDDGQQRLRRVGAKLHPGIAMSPIVPLYWRDAPAQSADDFASAVSSTIRTASPLSPARWPAAQAAAVSSICPSSQRARDSRCCIRCGPGCPAASAIVQQL
jgi:hypothetical protein